MEDLHSIIVFSYNREKVLGVVLKHYTNPLNDFYIIYAEYSLFEYVSDEECSLILSDVIIPSCDAAITEYRLKRQHIKDMAKNNDDINSLMDAMQNMNVDDLLK